MKPRRDHLLAGATFDGVTHIDPGLATVHSMAGMTKVSFVSGHIPGALVARFSEISEWCESLDTNVTFRTGAVSPDLAVVLSVHGFKVASELVLMSRDLVSAESPLPTSRHAWQISRSRLRAAERIDAAAFPIGWALTHEELALAAQSTSQAGLAFAREGWRKTAYVLAGMSDQVAYLQRLAVLPGHQGAGLGSMLTQASLQWAGHCGAAKMFVNTETDNEAALRLYRRHGFEVCDGGLLVMERAAQVT
mgnify:CR=1 FL=1